MVTPDAVEKCVRARWGAVASAASAVPGGLWFGRRPADTGSPYATFALTFGDFRFHGTAKYIQPVTLGVAVWVDVGKTGHDVAAVQAALDEAFTSKHRSMSVTGGTVLVCKPAPWSEALEDRLRSGLDVSVTRAAWRLVLEGTR